MIGSRTRLVGIGSAIAISAVLSLLVASTVVATARPSSIM